MPSAIGSKTFLIRARDSFEIVIGVSPRRRGSARSRAANASNASARRLQTSRGPAAGSRRRRPRAGGRGATTRAAATARRGRSARATVASPSARRRTMRSRFTSARTLWKTRSWRSSSGWATAAAMVLRTRAGEGDRVDGLRLGGWCVSRSASTDGLYQSAVDARPAGARRARHGSRSMLGVEVATTTPRPWSADGGLPIAASLLAVVRDRRFLAGLELMITAVALPSILGRPRRPDRRLRLDRAAQGELDHQRLPARLHPDDAAGRPAGRPVGRPPAVHRRARRVHGRARRWPAPPRRSTS